MHCAISVAYQSYHIISVDSCLQNKVTVYQLSHHPVCRVHFWSMEPQIYRMTLLGTHRLQLHRAFSRTLLCMLLLLLLLPLQLMLLLPLLPLPLLPTAAPPPPRDDVAARAGVKHPSANWTNQCRRLSDANESAAVAESEAAQTEKPEHAWPQRQQR